MMGDDVDDSDFAIAALFLQGLPPVLPSAAGLVESLTNYEPNPGTHTGDRRARRTFNHAQTYQLIQDHYLGPDALHGSQFKLQFRISKSTFEVIMQKIMSSNNPFYVSTDVRRRASNQARLLLPLKTLAYGVPMHCFIDYFNMSASFAARCCDEFDNAMISLFSEEFLRSPTPADVKSVVALHNHIYSVPGMFGSLDCTHTNWKSCPVAWQSSYKNSYNGAPSLVLEAIGDHHLYIWHFAYGFAGSMNDMNVLNDSHLLESWLNGEFEQKEKAAGVVPFTIGEQAFNQLYVLVDGIYPAYSRFVRAMNNPILHDEKFFSKWQEACRKDIERVFGVMKRSWKFLAHPIELQGLQRISGRVYNCLILHNMNVTERIMGSVTTRYDPSAVMERDTTGEPDDPSDIGTVVQRLATVPDGGDTPTEHPPNVNAFSLYAARADRLEALKSYDECYRLNYALKNYVNHHQLTGSK